MIIGGAIILVIVIALAILSAYAGPILRAKAIKMLQQRFDSEVKLDSFGVSFSHGVGVSGGGLVLHRKGDPGAPPLVVIKTFHVETGLWGLLRNPPHIGRVQLDGLELNVAAHHPDNSAANGGKASTAPHISVDELEANGTVLKIIPTEPGKDPLVFDIRQLSMRSVGPNQPMSFTATLRNPKPPGEIHSSGSFGPFQEHDAGRTPVSGSYTFEHANLGIFKGISGMLSSRGKYKGELDRIEVDGDTDTPDFVVRTGGHAIDLKTTFHSIVDGTNGDTLLQPVDAQFGHSSVHCVGGVVHHEGEKGKTVSLDVTVQDGRIEDMLRLAVKSPKPMMTGSIRFQTKFELPPGDGDVMDRLYLNGTFGIGSGHFTSENIQEKLGNLSHRAEGKPEEVGSDTGSVASNLKGAFVLKNGVITFSRLSFGVPGALIALNGTYNLDSGQMDFTGTARLQAQLSQMTTGWKSLLLKAVDPFFRKNGAGTEVPIKITGTREHPEFGVDFKKKF